jgi:hypothetical protein
MSLLLLLLLLGLRLRVSVFGQPWLRSPLGGREESTSNYRVWTAREGATVQVLALHGGALRGA